MISKAFHQSNFSDFDDSGKKRQSNNLSQDISFSNNNKGIMLIYAILTRNQGSSYSGSSSEVRTLSKSHCNCPWLRAGIRFCLMPKIDPRFQITRISSCYCKFCCAYPPRSLWNAHAQVSVRRPSLETYAKITAANYI